MTVQDSPPNEPESPFLEPSSDSRKVERRAWITLVMTVVLLVGGIAAPNAMYAYRIRRIINHGGYVVSRASYAGDELSEKFGSRFHRFYQDHFYIRDTYDVYLGDTDRSFDGCGAGITFVDAPDDDIKKDFGDEGPELVQALGRIRKVSFAETSVTDKGLAPLLEMTEIKIIDLSDTRIKGSGLSFLQDMNLEGLLLNSTDIDDCGFGFFPSFPELKHLDIGGTKASTRFLSRIASFSKLADLSVAGLPVTDAHVQQWAKLPLWRLDLSNTQVTDAAIPHLEKLTSLFDLNLCNTKVTLAAARATALPAIQRWVATRDLVYRPGACEVQ